MTPDEQKKAFEAELYTWVGKEIAPPTPGLDLVNEAMIRHWCEVMGDTNPVYTDAAAAAKTAKGGLIAPPTMLQAWSMEGYPMAFAEYARPVDDGRPAPTCTAYMEDHGFTGVLGTNCDQEYFRDLKPGDTVIAHTKIHSISEEKATGMGTGYFIETRTEFTDQNKELVGTMLFRVLKFKPAQAAKPVAENAQEENKAPTRAKSVRGHDNGVVVGATGKK
jgi:acyl dehydratase